MKEILMGLQEGLDVSIYAHPHFSHEQMKVLRNSVQLKNDEQGDSIPNLQLADLANVDYSAEKMNLILTGAVQNIDVSLYSNPSYTFQEMEAIYTLLMSDIAFTIN